MIKQFFSKHKYGFALFGILCLFLFSKSKYNLDEDIVISYVIDYSTGFGPRKFISTLVKAIFGVPTMSNIRLFAYCISILICGLFAWICDLYINRQKSSSEKNCITAIYLIVLYLIGPASLFFLLKYPNVGRLDIFLYGLCLIFCPLFYHRDKNRILYYLNTTILLCIGLLIHHIFVATYMVFIAALVVYDIWEHGFNKSRFFSYLTIGVISGSVLIAVLALSSMNIPLDEATHYNPNMELSRKFVCFGYYAHISDHIEQYIIPKWQRLIAGFCLTNLSLAPLFFAFWKIWRELEQSLQQKCHRNLLTGCLCTFLLFIPAFGITVDYLRWFGAFIFLQLLLIGYFSFDSNNLFYGINSVLQKNLRSNIFYAAILLIYCGSLGYFTSDTYFDGIELIMEKLHIHRVTTLLPLEYRF